MAEIDQALSDVTIQEILERKGSWVGTIDAPATLKEALRRLIEHKIGALIVVEEQMLIGIVTERDILRAVYQADDPSWQEQRVEEVMTANVLIGRPEDEVDYAMSVMRSEQYRHMPVIQRNRLVGLVSRGDVIQAKLQALEGELRELWSMVDRYASAEPSGEESTAVLDDLEIQM